MRAMNHEDTSAGKMSLYLSRFKQNDCYLSYLTDFMTNGRFGQRQNEMNTRRGDKSKKLSTLGPKDQELSVPNQILVNPRQTVWLVELRKLQQYTKR